MRCRAIGSPSLGPDQVAPGRTLRAGRFERHSGTARSARLVRPANRARGARRPRRPRAGSAREPWRCAMARSAKPIEGAPATEGRRSRCDSEDGVAGPCDWPGGDEEDPVQDPAFAAGHSPALAPRRSEAVALRGRGRKQALVRAIAEWQGECPFADRAWSKRRTSSSSTGRGFDRTNEPTGPAPESRPAATLRSTRRHLVGDVGGPIAGLRRTCGRSAVSGRGDRPAKRETQDKELRTRKTRPCRDPAGKGRG